jgi:hypothetical protein
MSNVGHGGGGWGRGRPWGGGPVWGGGWGGAPIEVLVPPTPPMPLPMDPATMAATGYEEIVGGPIDHWAHERERLAREHDHHHRWGMAGHEMAGFPPGYATGFMPDYEMGFMPDYEMGFMPDYEMGFMPDYEMGFVPGYEMGYTPMPGDQMMYLNDRRGLPVQGGYELGHVGYGAGQLPQSITQLEHMVHHEAREQDHRRAWDDHAARRGWDRGRGWQGGAPPPPGDWRGQHRYEPAPPMHAGVRAPRGVDEFARQQQSQRAVKAYVDNLLAPYR